MWQEEELGCDLDFFFFKRNLALVWPNVAFPLAGGLTATTSGCNSEGDQPRGLSAGDL